MKKLICFIILLFCIVLLNGCYKNKASLTEGYRKEANDFCSAHSIEYWKSSGLIEKLNAVPSTEQMSLFGSVFRSKITSKEMKEIVYEQTKELSAKDYYSHLQENISKLTKVPFNCPAIKKFYLIPDKAIDDIVVIDEDGISKFTTINDMFDSLADYSSVYGMFEMLSEEPLHVQLHPRFTKKELIRKENIEQMVNYAIVYGIYRTYIHTSIGEITVSSIPIEMNMDIREEIYLEGYKKTVSVTRQEALVLVQKYIDVESFEDLILKENGLPNQWLSDFELLVNDHNNLKMKKFMIELEAISSK